MRYADIPMGGHFLHNNVEYVVTPLDDTAHDVAVRLDNGHRMFCPPDLIVTPVINGMAIYQEHLPAFRITYANGENYITSMAKDVTLADAEAYFLNKSLVQADERTMLKVVKVEQVYQPPN